MGQYDYTNLTNLDITNNNKWFNTTITTFLFLDTNLRIDTIQKLFALFNNFRALLDLDRKNWSLLILKTKNTKIKTKYKNTKLQIEKLNLQNWKADWGSKNDLSEKYTERYLKNNQINSAELRIKIWKANIQNTSKPNLHHL